MIYPPKYSKLPPVGMPLCPPQHIWRPGVTRKSFIMAVDLGLHTSCEHDSNHHHYSTPFLDILATKTTPRCVPGHLWCVCRSICRDQSWCPQGHDRRAIYHCTTPCTNAMISISGDFQSQSCYHTWVPHTCNYFWHYEKLVYCHGPTAMWKFLL
jgi:hypothetical protein